MGGVVPDRFFWAQPPAEDGEPGTDSPADGGVLTDTDTPDTKGKPAPRRVH
jgi:hydroxymethylpyrimidine/phosphomethylpyrimidine kinase